MKLLLALVAASLWRPLWARPAADDGHRQAQSAPTIGLTWMNADRDTAVGPLTNGVTINLAQTPRINVRADVNSGVASVRFWYDSALFRTENSAPFAFHGNKGNDYFPFVPAVGCHSIVASSYATRDAQGTHLSSVTVNFCVVASASPPQAAPTKAPKAPTKAPMKAPTPVYIKPPTPAPIKQPAPAPVKLPTPAPVKPPTPAPVKAPTPAPVKAPTPATVKPPTTAPVAPVSGLPAGPYIASGYSERIVIPQPKAPLDLDASTRTNCPHLLGTNPDLKDWFASSTWANGVVPNAAGQAITLPANTKVVLLQSVAQTLGLITIPPTSSLIIGEGANGAEIEIKTTGMDVQGALIIGSETCRIQTPVTITLVGTRPANAVTQQPPPTYKGLSVTGTLSLHGKRYFRTWTRLAKTAAVGDTVLLLQDAVNWEAGQEIVLVTTAMKDSKEWHQNEVHTVSVVNSPNPVAGVGSVVYLTNPVKHKHLANKGYQAEVGLLTRTITIQGSASDSEPTDLDPLNCVNPNDKLRYNDKGVPCGYKEITGFGGHVMVHGSGKGFVQGVEFFRMGQTNVLGRYPMHFHLLGNCPQCYLRDSSFHHSFYRCISIHGTNEVTVSENVAYDVTGFCFYLEDGVEENNTLSFNLAAHIHAIGPSPPDGGGSQEIDPIAQSATLTLPADVSASGFYITNVRNNLIGNSASGGWAGFAFPILPTALQSFRTRVFRPSSVPSLIMDGNTVHSTGWWWGHAGGFYFGGHLYYNNGVLEYDPGRGGYRNPCKVNACELGNCDWGCPEDQLTSIRMTNSKAFLVAGVGLNSWTGSMDVIGWESHDTGLALESLSEGFWLDKALVVCRTGEELVIPTIPNPWQRIGGTGFVWYDTGQEHIVSDSVFRSCGYRSDAYNQYDTSATRGCGDSNINGCADQATAFGFLTHSDQFTPELMQGTRAISFENCGRRFSLFNWNRADTVSGRAQNWLDVDGSASGRNVPTFMVSGYASAAKWWSVDDNVGYDPQGPLRFINILPKVGAPPRGLGHVKLSWDEAEHSKVGNGRCGNGDNAPCPALGAVRHAGKRFSNSANKTGLAVTARGEVVGPVGGYAWILELDRGAPRSLAIQEVEVLPETPLLMSIAYPAGTTVTVTVKAPTWCYQYSQDYSCSEAFTPTDSVHKVRTGPGNQYHMDSNGVLTFRVIQNPRGYIGQPKWTIPSRTSKDYTGKNFALTRFERSGVFLPKSSYATYHIEATCGGSGPYCSGTPAVFDPDVCPSGYEQKAYDYCCSKTDSNNCIYAGTV